MRFWILYTTVFPCTVKRNFQWRLNYRKTVLPRGRRYGRSSWPNNSKYAGHNALSFQSTCLEREVACLPEVEQSCPREWLAIEILFLFHCLKKKKMVGYSPCDDGNRAQTWWPRRVDFELPKRWERQFERAAFQSCNVVSAYLALNTQVIYMTPSTPVVIFPFQMSCQMNEDLISEVCG